MSGHKRADQVRKVAGLVHVLAVERTTATELEGDDPECATQRPQGPTEKKRQLRTDGNRTGTPASVTRIANQSAFQHAFAGWTSIDHDDATPSPTMGMV